MTNGKPAPKNEHGPQAAGPSTPELYVVALALCIVLVITLLVVWFYGPGNETATVAVLGATFTAIGTLVGTVFGVTSGAKSGAAGGLAGGQQVAHATTRSATTAMTNAIQSVKNLKDEADQVANRVATLHTTATTLHAKAMPHLAPGTVPPEPVDLTPLQEKIKETLSRAQGALDVISAGP